MLKLYNTLTRKKEVFKPLRKDWVGLYTCGPTVYNFQHIGNYRTYIFEDVLRRTFEENGYKVKHVMNVTDVGHLVSDADQGEDKIEKGAKREGKSVWEIAKFYTADFLKNIKKLNIKKANVVTPATKNIKEQINLIEELFKKGLAYETSKAIYFDVSKFPNYTKLSGQKLTEKKTGARDEVVIDKEKRNPQDFALWFKLVSRFKNHVMRWPSPWGPGFPGWHIECSAISTKYLDQPFDIHAGGIDHVNVHHTNEIAQSEGAYEKPLAKFWMHGEHLLVGSKKMAKSLGNFYTLRDLEQKGFNPLVFRYLMLTSHYRSKINFTWDSIAASQNSLSHLYEFVKRLAAQNKKPNAKGQNLDKYKKQFEEAVFNDLDMPKALAIVWNLINQYNKSSDRFNSKDVLKTLYDFDKILGLDLKDIKSEKIPTQVLELVRKREEYRNAKNWSEADKIREEIKKLGYAVDDISKGPEVKKL